MPSLNSGVPALIFRLDRNPFHHGSLGAVRSLGRAGVEVHAFTESPRVPLARSAYLHRPHPMPDAPGGTQAAADAAAVAALDRAGARIGRRAVLIPMDDRAALLAARLPPRVRSRFLLAEVAPDLPERLADKSQLVGLCSDFDISHPSTEQPRSAAEVRRGVARLGLPLIAKWSRPWELPADSGLRSTTPIHSEAEALNLYERTAEAGCPLLLQRLLPGRPGADWFFHGCFGADGRLLAGGTGRKELSWPVGAGLTAAGSWLPHTQLTRDAVRLAQRLGYRGILDLDFRWDPDTGAYHLLDANPRPGAQFRLFTDRSGTDVVRALHLDLTGRAVPDPRPVPGRLFVTENYAPVSALLTARGRRAPAAPRPPIGGRRQIEPAWFAPDDLAPFLAMAARTVRRAARRLAAFPPGPARPPAAALPATAPAAAAPPATAPPVTGRRRPARAGAGGGAGASPGGGAAAVGPGNAPPSGPPTAGEAPPRTVPPDGASPAASRAGTPAAPAGRPRDTAPDSGGEPPPGPARGRAVRRAGGRPTARQRDDRPAAPPPDDTSATARRHTAPAVAGGRAPAARGATTGRPRTAPRTAAAARPTAAGASSRPSPTPARAEPAPSSAPRSNSPETTGTSRKVSGDY